MARHRALLLLFVALSAGCSSTGADDTSRPTNSARTLAATGASGAASDAPDAAATATDVSAATSGGKRWWNDRVFYEIFVRSFADSTTGALANDGIGDLTGLIEKLDYLNDGNPATSGDLGITGIWLMPINPSPSYHGYDVTDYFGVNPQYGSRADFERLLAECHRRGIKVIVDLVLNHSSSQHPYFRKALDGESVYRDWYVFAERHAVPDVRGPWNQQVWQEARGQHYYGIFWSGMPDLNYRNAAVTAEAYRIAEYWLRDVGVDGFRLDAIRHLIEDGDTMSDTPETFSWLRDFRAHVQQVAPSAVIVGEVWTNTETVSEYVQVGSLDLAFEFDLGTAILEAVQTGQRDKLAYTLDNVVQSYPPHQYATIITNHDQDRIASVLGEDPAQLKLAASLLLAAPGVPFLYYGEEIGQVGAKPDEMIRNPMPWNPGPNGGFTAAAQPWEPLQRGHERRNVATQHGDRNSLLNHYRRWIRLRQSEPALLRGDFKLIETGRRDVICWQRTTAARTLTFIANLGARPIEKFMPNGLNPVKLGSELLATGPAADRTDGLTLAPYAAHLFAAGQ